MKVTRRWHRLPREIVKSPSQEILKSHLDTDAILGNWLTTDCPPMLSQGRTSHLLSLPKESKGQLVAQGDAHEREPGDISWLVTTDKSLCNSPCDCSNFNISTHLQGTSQK